MTFSTQTRPRCKKEFSDLRAVMTKALVNYRKSGMGEDMSEEKKLEDWHRSHRLTSIISSQQGLVNWPVTPGIGWVRVLRRRHTAATSSGSGGMWA